MTIIHPTAIVDPAAELADSVQVGAYSVIGPKVTIGADTVIGPHVVVEGPTTIGQGNRIFQFASVGAAPQDKKYRGEDSALEIGDRNTIREFCTLNRGTADDVGVTRIGHDNWIMAYVHIAHDCQLGSNITIANTTNLAGHVHLGNWVTLGGCSQIHQFCKIGAHAMTAVGTVVLHDIPPFVMAAGNTASAHGLNVEGLRRRGFSPEAIAAIRRAYKTLYRNGLTFEQARTALADEIAAPADAAIDAIDTPAAGTPATTPPADVAASLTLFSSFLAQVTRGIVR